MRLVSKALMFVLFGAMLSVLLVGSAHAAQRKVLAEMFTNTSCGPCGPANQTLDQVYESNRNIMTVIRYHVWWPSSSDPFYQANISENTTRTNYYGVHAVPNLHIDGHIDAGYQHSQWESRIREEAQEPTPVTIQLELQYTPETKSGIVIATVEIESTITSNNLRLFYVIVEDSVYYPAPNGEDWHNQVMRDMIPDAYGKPITLTQGTPIVDTAEFTLDQSWNEAQCFIVVFVQDYATKWVYQSEVAAIVTFPVLKFDHFNITDGVNNVPDPGDTVTMHLFVRNDGRIEATNVSVSLESQDPYIEVLSPTQVVNQIGIGQAASADFQLYIDPACPDSYFTYLVMNMMTSDSIVFSDTFPFMVDVTPGFVDDFEGDTVWIRYGRMGMWHHTEHRYASPTHSFYNGFENYWFYADNAEYYAESPFFVVGDGHSLRFWHCYWIETGYDYGYVEISTDSSRWSVVGSYTGVQSNWTEETIDLSDYVGSPVKMRFKFTSDGSVHYEGWYVDDITVNLTSVEEHEVGRFADEAIGVRFLSGNLVLQVPENSRYQIEAFDVTGRKIATVFNGDLTAGRHTFAIPNLRSGVYFFVVKSENGLKSTSKLVYVR